MNDPRASTVPSVHLVRDERGDRIVVTFKARPELACDCSACRAQLEGATTSADDVEGVAR
jgi:hypothetical protein